TLYIYMLLNKSDFKRFKESRSTAGRELCGDVHSEFTYDHTSTVAMSLSSSEYMDIYEDFENAHRLRVMKRELCPAHDRVWSETLDRKPRMLKTVTRVLHVIGGLFYIICPPWPPWIIHKIAFRAPSKGEYYFLVGGEKDHRQAYFTARDAEGVKNLQICLPHLLRKKLKAIDIYYHILRCKPVILKLYEDLWICAMEIMCEQTEKWLRRTENRRTRSPKLIIFAQPNSSDIGCCMLMDPNFADIADFLRCDLLVFDYAGYGISDGEATEQTVYDSVDRVYKYATEELGYVPKDIILIGFSLGTAAMVHIASRTPDLGAMVLIAPFTSLWRVILHRPNIMGSSRLDMFSNYDKAQDIKCPTLICHGKDDSIVDHHHGLVMKERIEDCELFLITASHQGIFCERKMWDAIRGFLFEKVNITAAWMEAVRESALSVSAMYHA
uniref:AB hydrolase-1 domain-containing protein n=1 Tax=Haemonchus contortus TaxID=6289 RepID=A0A7I4XU43_HAECO